MKTFLCIVVAVVLTLLVCIPIHFSLTKWIRMDRFRTIQYLDQAHEEIYYLKAKEADRQRVGGSPKYRMLIQKQQKGGN